MKNIKGFTLIELLMVIAIIGILAGILIPTVGAVRKQANLAASKAQLTGYVNAIQMFKGEYGYFPFVGANDKKVELSSSEMCKEFIKEFAKLRELKSNREIFISHIIESLLDASVPFFSHEVQKLIDLGTIKDYYNKYVYYSQK